MPRKPCFGSAVVNLADKHCAACPNSAACVASRPPVVDPTLAYEALASAYCLPFSGDVFQRLQLATVTPSSRKDRIKPSQASLFGPKKEQKE